MVKPLISKAADVVGSASFTYLLVLFTLPCWMLGRAGLVLAGIVPQIQQYLPAIMYPMMCMCWWALMMFSSFWVKQRYQGVDEFQKAMTSGAGKPRCLICNHSSFLDSFLGVSIMPFWQIGGLRTMASSHLLSMPVISTLARGCGHFMVPFKSQEASGTDMCTDKSKVAEIQVGMENHLKSGGICVWFPEGRMNKENPLQVATFRAGGFQSAANVDCEIWCMAQVGNAVCWPAVAALGGRPSKISVHLYRLCESSEALLESMPAPPAGEDLLKAKCIYLAQYAQASMQKAIDTIVEEGWASGTDDSTKKLS